MSDVFQEVEEEYRREQMAKFWQKYRMAVVGGVAALVVGVAGFQGWNYWRASQIEASSRAFDAAGQLLAQGANKESADALAKVAANGTGAYPLMAKLQEAAIRAQAGDVKAAVALYDGIGSSGAGGALLSEYAQLRAAILLVEQEPFDAIKKRVEPLANGEGPWRLQAKELLAYAGWRAGKKDDALKLYAEIQAAPGVTAGTKRRAVEMSALINAGMKLSDVKVPLLLAPKPAGAAEPLLLPPPSSPAAEDPSSLLGPNPVPPTPSP